MSAVMKAFKAVQSIVGDNQVLKDYELGKHVATGGPGMFWKIHDAVHKSSKQIASVFLFDKKTMLADKTLVSYS